MLIRLNSPILYVRNIEKAKDFYTKNLGFQIEQDQGKFVYLSLGESKIAQMLADKEGELPGHQTIILNSDNVADDYKKIRSSGAKITLDLANLGWGNTFIFEDLDRNKIEVVK